MKDYRSKHHYHEPSDGGLLLLLMLVIGGGLLGGFGLPMVLEVMPSRAGGAGAIAGLVVWLLAANR